MLDAHAAASPFDDDKLSDVFQDSVQADSEQPLPIPETPHRFFSDDYAFAKVTLGVGQH